PHGAGPGGGVAARLPAGRLARVLPAGGLVADVRRPGHRHGLVRAAAAAGGRGAAVGPRQRQEGAGLPGEGAEPQPGAAGGERDVRRGCVARRERSGPMSVGQRSGVRRRRWTRKEFYRLLDLNFFLGQRVELIEGEILVMAARKNFHAVAIKLTEDALEAVF